MSEDGHLVRLYVYDLSNGLCAQLSPMLLGRRIEAIYHTSVVVGGVEYYYGGGIQEAVPDTTPYGRPIQVLDLGRTEVPQELLQQFLIDISDRFSPQAYRLMSNNCNNFSDELATFLTGSGIPAHITALPSEVLATPFGASLAPLLSGLEAQLSNPAQQQHAVTRQNPHPPVLPGSATATPAATTASSATPTPPFAQTPVPQATSSTAAAAKPTPATVTQTPLPAATPILPPPPRKAGVNGPANAGGGPTSAAGNSDSPCVAAAAAAARNAAKGRRSGLPAQQERAGGQAGKSAVGQSAGVNGAGNEQRQLESKVRTALRFETPAPAARPTAAAAESHTGVTAPVAASPVAAAAAAAEARAAAASTVGATEQQQQQQPQQPQPVAHAPTAQAFRAALQQEFQRILATGVSANEAASLALKILHSRQPAAKASG